MFTSQFIVMKNLGIIESMKRSYGFVKSNLADVVIYGTVVFVVSILFAILTGGLSVLVEFTVPSGMSGAFVRVFLNLFSILAGLVLAPYFEIVKTKLVFDAGEVAA